MVCTFVPGIVLHVTFRRLTLHHQVCSHECHFLNHQDCPFDSSSPHYTRSGDLLFLFLGDHTRFTGVVVCEQHTSSAGECSYELCAPTVHNHLRGDE